MKTSVLTILSCMYFAFSAVSQDVKNIMNDYPIIPKPVELQIKSGRFQISDNTKITGEESLKNEGNFLAKLLSGTTGKQVVFDANTKEAAIHLKLDDVIEQEEGYQLQVDKDNINIIGKTAKGVFYGIQTLRQLVSDGGSVPAVLVNDYPRFGYRGMLLDVGRHFLPASFIKEFIDLMAMHKMNTFHWHLTEDQGWRIEIKKYPKLTEVGAYRNGTIVGHLPGEKNDETRYGGFYTQEEIKDIVAYAAKKHITVIPEIELPGHAGAAIAAYPHLSCFPEEPTIVPNDMMSKKSREQQKANHPKMVQETWGV
ncbi:MAG: beta-N-acetylglucosaminidase, partial [Flavobacteriales bacterium]